jgi:glucan 1,3-beta-glucosidase
MGLNSTWDDSAKPNDNVPALNDSFPYGSSPIRGVNIGGWLSIEPFITPSLFSRYPITDGIVDEYTLSQKLGSSAASTIEEHYATFIQEEDFAQMAAAGLDHVRIPYSYWAVTTYSGDPYVEKISWRYLLRSIEYCRKYGLRVNLDLHGLPGSQNGENHSGRQGAVRWLNGTDGDLNAQRSLDIHDQLSQFFAQSRYKNIVTMYGLVNEPPLLSLDVATVLNWTIKATELVQKNGIKAKIVMGDGFLNLDKWQYMMKTDVPSNMLLDTHQYTIFNTNEIDLTHTAKINLTCSSWLSMLEKVNSTTNGYVYSFPIKRHHQLTKNSWGPTINGEFSQSDTDCAVYLNNVGAGTRWTGNIGSTSDPRCPTAVSNSDETTTTTQSCSCNDANAAASSYSDDYKKFLQTYAEAQMYAFEKMMGWFYWTWQTESAPQWSYKQAWQGGFMPKLAYQPDFKCGDAVPSFGSLPEYY